jgi:hypothetical protein
MDFEFKVGDSGMTRSGKHIYKIARIASDGMEVILVPVGGNYTESRHYYALTGEWLVGYEAPNDLMYPQCGEASSAKEPNPKQDTVKRSAFSTSILQHAKNARGASLGINALRSRKKVLLDELEALEKLENKLSTILSQEMGKIREAVTGEDAFGIKLRD